MRIPHFWVPSCCDIIILLLLSWLHPLCLRNSRDNNSKYCKMVDKKTPFWIFFIFSFSVVQVWYTQFKESHRKWDWKLNPDPFYLRNMTVICCYLQLKSHHMTPQNKYPKSSPKREKKLGRAAWRISNTAENKNPLEMISVTVGGDGYGWRVDSRGFFVVALMGADCGPGPAVLKAATER